MLSESRLSPPHLLQIAAWGRARASYYNTESLCQRGMAPSPGPGLPNPSKRSRSLRTKGGKGSRRRGLGDSSFPTPILGDFNPFCTNPKQEGRAEECPHSATTLLTWALQGAAAASDSICVKQKKPHCRVCWLGSHGQEIGGVTSLGLLKKP